jgi:phosphoribosyl-AMP cyclohydrolase
MVFDPVGSASEQENGGLFRPKFDDNGLITAIACDAETGEVLMLAHMNADALEKTIRTGKAHYWSRSRAKIWLKGESSGNVQQVISLMTDCDQDAVLMRVQVKGADASCHTGRISCFYRSIETGKDGKLTLKFDDRAPRFSPDSVYKKQQE